MYVRFDTRDYNVIPGIECSTTHDTLYTVVFSVFCHSVGLTFM